MFNFLQTGEVIDLYNLSIKRFGGLKGIRDLKLLESSVNQVPLIYKISKCSIEELAAYYCYLIIKNHPFIDGNKRAGLLTSLVFLQKNNYKFDYDNNELFNIILDIASSSKNVSELADFFKYKK